jgi:hypothetical protein
VARADSFYVPTGEGRWSATTHATGPWEPGAQHGGPPSALLGRAIERCAPRPEMVVARVTVEILGAVPVAEVEVAAEVARPGRSVELVIATMRAGGREVARAASWRVLRTQAPAAAPATARRAPARPAEADERHPDWWTEGYLTAMEWRAATGGFGAGGPAVVWARMRYPLVPDEEPTGLQRLLALADSGNGLSSELDLREWMFINPELTVHLHREPVGEWQCIDAVTSVTPGGAGLATSVLSDDDGPVGVGAQSLLVVARR